MGMTISEYTNICKDHNPCEEGLSQLENCKTRREAFNLLASPVACDYFLQSIQEGWGPGPRDVERLFRPYINGGLSAIYSADNKRIKTQVWCRCDEVEIEDDVRWLILVGCQGVVNISDYQVVKIFVDSHSVVEINASKGALVYIVNYGGRVRDVNGNCKFRNNG